MPEAFVGEVQAKLPELDLFCGLHLHAGALPGFYTDEPADDEVQRIVNPSNALNVAISPVVRLLK